MFEPLTGLLSFSAFNLNYVQCPAGGDSTGFKQQVWLYLSLWENDPAHHVILLTQ